MDCGKCGATDMATCESCPGGYQEERLAGNKFHYHETMDRAHLICSMIDDFLIDSPGMEEEQNKWCDQAQKALTDVAGRAAELSEKLKG